MQVGTVGFLPRAARLSRLLDDAFIRCGRRLGLISSLGACGGGTYWRLGCRLIGPLPRNHRRRSRGRRWVVLIRCWSYIGSRPGRGLVRSRRRLIRWVRVAGWSIAARWPSEDADDRYDGEIRSGRSSGILLLARLSNEIAAWQRAEAGDERMCLHHLVHIDVDRHR